MGALPHVESSQVSYPWEKLVEATINNLCIDRFFQHPHRTRCPSFRESNSWITLGLKPCRKACNSSCQRPRTLIGSPDFGGSLPISSTLWDPLFEQLPPRLRRPRPLPSSERSLPQLQTPEPEPPTPPSQAQPPVRLDTSAPAVRSPFNPFYGYPVSPTSLNPRYGRRRKRDLLRTLAYLWWAKWKGTVIWATMLILAFWVTRWRLRIRLNRRRQMVIQQAQR